MRKPAPDEEKMARNALETQMRMILRLLEQGEPVNDSLRKRTYFPDALEFFQEERRRYAEKLAALPSPERKAPDYAREYVDKVRSHADALDDLRKQLKHLNRRLDLDDSQKRQHRPAIIRQYAELRGSFRGWLKEWEEKAGYYADAELYFCKPEPADRDYQWGRQYRWYFRFISVSKHNSALDLEAHMASVEMLWLRRCLGIDAQKTNE